MRLINHLRLTVETLLSTFDSKLRQYGMHVAGGKGSHVFFLLCTMHNALQRHDAWWTAKVYLVVTA